MDLLVAPAFSASKKKSKKAEPEPVPVVVEKTEEAPVEKTSIPLPEKKRTFFSSIDSDVVSLVESGTPAAIQTAMTKIHKNESEYTENEKVLITIASEIMGILWPSQKVTWQIPVVQEENSYTAAIQSAKKGIFDSSTGNTDFYTTLLPALVLFYPSSAMNNDYAEIETAIKAAEKINQQSVLPKYMLGVLYELQGKYELAASCLNYVYEKMDYVLDSSLVYAKILTEEGNLEYANTVLQKIMKDNPSNIQVLRQAAYIAFARRDFTGAEEYVARVLQQTPNDLEFVLFRAKIFVEKNDYIHAVSLLDMYARQDNSSLDYLLLRAKVQLDWSKNTTAAIETVEKTLQLYPSNPDALMLAARLSSITDSPVAGKYADELAALVLEIAPENREARVYALEGLMQRENWDGAYEISRDLVKYEPVDAKIILCHVTNCIETNRNKEALEIAEKAYNSNKTDETICQAYIYAYSNAGKREDSIALINSLMNDASPKLKSYLYYSRSYLQMTEDTILADLRSSLIANPRNSDSLLRLYEIYFAKEDYRKAQYYLRQVVAINPNDSSIKKLNEALTKLIK